MWICRCCNCKVRVYSVIIDITTIRTMWQVFTCDLEGAFACTGLVDDVTGVLPPAVAVEAADRVLRLIFLGVEGSGVEQPVREKPLESQHTGGVGSQHPAGHHHRSPEALTHLAVNRFHCRRVCARDRKAQTSSAKVWQGQKGPSRMSMQWEYERKMKKKSLKRA